MTPEERAKAVAEYFAVSLPPAVRPQLEKVIASAIHRAVNQELAKLERMADAAETRAHGKGKSAKVMTLLQSIFIGSGKRNSGRCATGVLGSRSSANFARGLRYNMNEGQTRNKIMANIYRAVQRPAIVVLLMWVAVILFSAWAARGPVHRNDIPPYWSFESFVTILLGPLAAFFVSPRHPTIDYVGAILYTLGLLGGTLLYVWKPKRLSLPPFL